MGDVSRRSLRWDRVCPGEGDGMEGTKGSDKMRCTCCWCRAWIFANAGGAKGVDEVLSGGSFAGGAGIEGEAWEEEEPGWDANAF